MNLKFCVFNVVILIVCHIANYHTADGQLLAALGDLISPITSFFGGAPGPRPGFPGFIRGAPGIPGQGGPFRDDGTQIPQATGRDELFPADCGRNENDGTGKLCFPDGLLCQQRLNRPGIERFGGHNYWLSWRDPQLANTNWDWFNARNYCRKRCMDLVSFETVEEYEHFKEIMSIENTPFIWTSGRLCDFAGCEREEFLPKNINGWFWSANQVRLAPTNSKTEFHDWSFTGGFNPPRVQPDNREQIQDRGDSESCLAVLNNFYGDGVKWHDVACKHEKPIICEDVEGHIAYARQTFPHINIP